MGFLDKLLGRGKDAAQDVEETARDAGDTAKDASDDAESRVSGEDELSETGQSEERLGNIRDQARGDEGRPS